MYKKSYNEDDLTIKLSRQRNPPRAKELNETLLSRPSGKMINPKDISRNKQKRNLRDMLDFDNFDD